MCANRAGHQFLSVLLFPLLFADAAQSVEVVDVVVFSVHTVYVIHWNKKITAYIKSVKCHSPRKFALIRFEATEPVKYYTMKKNEQRDTKNI